MSTPKTSTKLTLKLVATERAAIRGEVFQCWLAEKPGDLSVRHTYRYDVETLTDGSLIYLTRPTHLNHGVDFIVCVENFKKYKNKNDRPPTQNELIEELLDLSRISAAHKTELVAAVKRIWSCEKSSTVLSDLILFKADIRASRALLLAKWLFIEQDVTYWNESGRWLLRSGIETKVGPFP